MKPSSSSAALSNAAACLALLAAVLLSASTATCQLVSSTSGPAAGVADEASAANTFRFKLNFFASHTGQYEVEGYDGVAPVLEMAVGETYTFDQTDLSNWYHPLGFAYYPDGAHDDKPEVEDDAALVYLIDGTQPAENLDGYEPEFFFPREAWAEKKYTVQLTVTPEIAASAKGGEIFYFCHIHAGMSGRIKIVGAEPVGEPVPLPPLGERSEFDAMCGTTEASAFATGAAPDRCPGQTFLCAEDGSVFAQCMHAVDCKMQEEMRVQNEPSSPVATFMHQMIPHHENAVNMAKILLKQSGAGLDEEVEDMLYAIINGQNAQITFMRGWLKENEYAADHNEVACEAPAAAGALAASQPTSGAVATGTSALLSASLAAALLVLAAAL